MDAPIRVFFMISTLGRGGAEKQLVTLLDHLDPKQVQAQLLCLSREAHEFWTDYVLSRPHIQAFFMPPGHGQWARLRRVGQLIRAFRPHIVWGWSFFTSLYALPFCLGQGIKMVASLRNDGRYLLIENAWAPWFLRYAHAAVANTEVAFKELAALGHFPKKCLVLPNIVALPDETIPVADEVQRVGYCGNFHHRKGLDVFVQAAALLLERGMRLQFVLAGKGDATSLQEHIKTLGIEDAFRFPGEVSCASFVKQLDLFVLPSRHEGCPNVLLETMALGIPCIGTRVGGIPEIVSDGENGILVPAEDPTALADAIAKACSDPLLRRRIGEAGRQSMRSNREGVVIAQEVFPKLLRAILD